jgi:hypothetical protein
VGRRRIFINEVKEEIGNIKSMEVDCFYELYINFKSSQKKCGPENCTVETLISFDW